MTITVKHKVFKKEVYPGLGNVQMTPIEEEVEVTYTPVGISTNEEEGKITVFFETSLPGCNLTGTIEFPFTYQGIDTVYKEAEKALLDKLVPVSEGS